jgi:N-acetylglutamate synthase and related acetyltransferases
MPAIDYHIATSADEVTLASILHDTAMAGWVNMQLLRMPSYFSADALYGNTYTILARCGDEPVGLCRLQCLPVWVNGRATKANYLAGLRILPRFRHRLSVLHKGFTVLRSLCEDKQPLCFTSIAHDNATARRLLEAGLPKMPRYTLLAGLHTLAFSSRQGQPGQALRQATEADIPALVAFHNDQAAQWQFAPLLDEAWLRNLSRAQALSINDFLLYEEQGKLRTCVALWDQRQLKQTVAQNYRAPLNIFRCVYNGYAHLTKRINLPSPGKALNQAYLAFFASNLETSASIALLREALWHLSRRDIAVGVLGLAATNPLREVFQRTLRPTQYETCIESVCFFGDQAVELDDRPPQPEAALL